MTKRSNVPESGPGLWLNGQGIADHDNPRSPQRLLWAEIAQDEVIVRDGVSPVAALGVLITFLTAALEQLKNDNMAAVTDETLEEWAHWAYTPGVGARALRKLLQDADGRLDWDSLRPWVRRTDPYLGVTEPRLRPPLR
jgi:hypothetical protein